MGDISKMIQWMKDREGKVTYSMTNRLGPNSYDCSSAVYNALIAGGFLPKGTAIGNTETLYALEGKLLQPISRGSVKRGDIFVSGVKGNSLGAGGHTGIFLDNQTIIHATYSPDYGKNGIVTTPAENWMGDYNGWPVYYYRLNGANDSGRTYSGGALTNAGFTLSEANIKLVINAAKLYNIKPSFMIAQMFIESHWGDPSTSTVGSVDNNWSGISEPFHVPADLGINTSRGSARPSNEGGYYVHFATLNDFFKAYAFLLSRRNGLYNVEGTTTIEAYCKGLFRVGGAKADYAASGYQHYMDMLVPTYNAINQQNPGKLAQIDASSGGDTPLPPGPPTPVNFSTNVHYGLRVLGGSWLGEVTNFNNSNSDGFAGLPYHSHDLLYIKVDKGQLRYRAHTAQSGWLGWVSKGDKNDTVNGCAGMPGQAIDGVQIYYTTPSGQTLSQAYYRSQTTARAGWLPVCCDDGTSIAGFDGWAGMMGEPLDRLQIGISQSNPF